jgi:hypothetical protein
MLLMPFTVSFRGTPIACDTVAEVKALLADEECVPYAVPPVRSSHVSVDTDAIAVVLSSLNRLQTSFIALIARNDKISDKDARNELELRSNKQLAGVLAAIAKRFKSAKLPNVVQTEIAFSNGTRTYTYRLSEDGTKALEAAGMT